MDVLVAAFRKHLVHFGACVQVLIERCYCLYLLIPNVETHVVMTFISAVYSFPHQIHLKVLSMAQTKPRQRVECAYQA